MVILPRREKHWVFPGAVKECVTLIRPPIMTIQ